MVYLVQTGWKLKKLKHTCTFACNFDRHAKKFATEPGFQHITLYPGNPGHYMNVFKTSTILNDGQQQPVDNFAPRTNLKRFFKDNATSSGDSEVKEAASRYFC
jgi:hypothetical protein